MCMCIIAFEKDIVACVCTHTHSLTNQPTHPLTHLLNQSRTYTLMQSAPHSPTRSPPPSEVHPECEFRSDCEVNQFCGMQCWTGNCGKDGKISLGAIGKYCQPCKECIHDSRSESGSCNVCPPIVPGGPRYRSLGVPCCPGSIGSVP